MQKFNNSEIDEVRNASFDHEEKMQINKVEEYIVLPSTVDVDVLSSRR